MDADTAYFGSRGVDVRSVKERYFAPEAFWHWRGLAFFWLGWEAVGKEGSRQGNAFLRYLFGGVYFAPGASRVSARQPSYFFSAKPKKVSKKRRATSVPFG
ncbi:MAG: hypothetical protein ORN29_01155, partial [Rhodoferax sp.]|nr:hypothetical protein [Rhodoferax sp.]